MIDTIIDGGAVVTMNGEREILENGAIAIDGSRIVDVGPATRIRREYDAKSVIDGTGHAVLPGFISTHVHVSGILLRGLGNYRNLFDWLLNVKRPGTNVMTKEEHEIAAALYSKEALESGITTFVENATGAGGYGSELIERKLSVYDAAGVRNIYAYAFSDKPPGKERITDARQVASREPEVNHVLPDETVTDAETALETVETLIEQYHGTADGRQSVWPAPYYVENLTPEALAGAYELAEKYDVMTTTHAAEDAYDERQGRLSNIEYLYNAGYLGERTLLGHCVQVSESDIRTLAVTGAKVAHNILANLALGEGVAPVPRMQNYGVTVALGTDNVPNSDTVNMLKDMRFAALVQKGVNHDAGVLTAEKAIEMATIDAATAIGREDDLGSIEAGKLADIVMLDLEQTHLTPHTYLPSAIVYQTQGFEVDTVLCNGEIVMQDRTTPQIDALYDDLTARAMDASAEIIERAGLQSIRDRSWTAINP